jgi:hypothetical protein
MPKYAWEDPKTGEQWETDMKYEEMLQYKEDNPHLHQIFAINFVSSQYVSSGGLKNDDGWNEMMSRIGEAHPDSDIGDKYRKKTIKEIKTKEAIDKNRKRLGLVKDTTDTSAGIAKHGVRTSD